MRCHTHRGVQVDGVPGGEGRHGQLARERRNEMELQLAPSPQLLQLLRQRHRVHSQSHREGSASVFLAPARFDPFPFPLRGISPRSLLSTE